MPRVLFMNACMSLRAGGTPQSVLSRYVFGHRREAIGVGMRRILKTVDIARNYCGSPRQISVRAQAVTECQKKELLRACTALFHLSGLSGSQTYRCALLRYRKD